MNEEVTFYIEEGEERMTSTLSHLEDDLGKIRAGRANPKVLQDVKVDYYGTLTPLNQVANIMVPDPRTISIQPWERTMIAPIEKAIMAANLGFNPSNNGEVIRILVPVLTEERRKDLVKQSRGIGETAKVAVRNIRRDVIDTIKKMVKNGLSEDVCKDAEDTVQKKTDAFVKSIDELLTEKEKDIMTI